MSDLGNKEIMAENIRYWMEFNGFSATDVCRMLDIPQATFNYWIHARTYPRIDKIEKMANLFGITKPDLIEKRRQSTVEKNDGLSKEESVLIDIVRDMTPDERKSLIDFLSLKRKQEQT